MTSRVPIVVGNWKLNLSIAEGVAVARGVVDSVADIPDVQVGIAPVATGINAVARQLDGSRVFVCGQDCFWEDTGAWTGAISAPMLRDAGCTYTIVGHSERRTHFGDTDAIVGHKAAAALHGGLSVIICCGETEAQRRANETSSVVRCQLDGALTPLSEAHIPRIVIAYEPVWAIGTGLTATPDQAQAVHADIRAALQARYNDGAERIRIQYGGSVKPGNAARLFAQPDIDGALVGGASLRADSFSAIVATAAAMPR